MARRRRQLHIIGHPQFAVDGRIQRHLPSRDGLHLSRRETATLVEDIERDIRSISSAQPSQHPTSSTPPNIEDSTPYMTALLKTDDGARISSDKEWPALPEVKYAPISPSLLTSTSSSFLSSHSYFLWSGDELQGDSENNMSEASAEDSRSGRMRTKNPDSVVLNMSCHKL